MIGAKTRSKSKSLDKMDIESKENGVISNGFHGYKEGYKTLENSEMNRRLTNLFNKLILPLALVGLTPQIVMLYWYTNVKFAGSYSTLIAHFRSDSVLGTIVAMWNELSIFNTFTVGVIFGYFAWALFWMVVLPGKEVHGPVTPKGNVPQYKDNGFLHYCVTMAGFAILTIVLKYNGLTPKVVYDRFGELLGFMNVFALCFVFLLYIKGITRPSTSDSGKTGGGFVFDYYWGTELYPRICGIDVKVFTNCRFGMTVWPLLVCIYALKSYEIHGFVDSMFVTTILQLTYITKFFTWEAGYMHTIDIILDRAGYYICWGCLCWLPSLYPIVSHYLVTHPLRLGTPLATSILVFGLFSVLINYLADLQRQDVRKANGDCLVWGRKPDLIRAKYRIECGEVRESILLASGWWGLSRHFHYIPEILLSFFWTVTTGFEYVLPYTYVIVLVILLTHRSFRDEQKCSMKYGVYWQEYCTKVRHRIIPFLF
ncbi:uncharacterized protein LOC127862105 [Dreissena polymorpha]|nr:uncharacterized protein LOC127862105 [Dreissena polymorpha]XP_052257038.1 uncharacterized protein LOC127862105 [Dreissena polymorpha]XP_052257039.1 uncharacterized protein LOC127862105 [Dreissena polymorpha]XP_052257040.1 uncharacterized protein LOC127862105 [Dreissena polymorpha]XP_052257041.1 uncharacterized protein LOC127862105 [Dreissena polymorpha]XP_052257042.1 uncharacterized protein LOC127862105 [Dreissena polymorpha]